MIEETHLTKAYAESLDTRLREVALRTAATFIDFAALAAEAIKLKIWERFGYLNEAQYFEERVGVSHRTLQRWLQINNGVDRLPEEEKPEAREMLSRIGVQKAASMAPVLGRPEVNWRAQLEFA